MDVKRIPHSTTPSDAVLASRVRDTGDEAAFRALYGRHTPVLFPFALRLMGGVQPDAEDVVQDTWVRAVRALPAFRWESTFRSWLMGIALNRAREILRRRARRNGLMSHAPAPTPPRIPDGERIDLERAIGALPEGYRVVFVLHDVEGFTHEEIGRRLQIAVGTSRSQLHHARRSLRRLLGEHT